MIQFGYKDIHGQSNKSELVCTNNRSLAFPHCIMLSVQVTCNNSLYLPQACLSHMAWEDISESLHCSNWAF